MNPRKFTIIDNDTQRTSVFESSAETVAELKRDLIAHGFSVEGKTIQEGLTRIEFRSGDAVLPHDVPRNGTITNDLVFRLTKSEKNIKSGSMSRLEAYAKIKELNLGDTIKNKYGKNFTQCTTADLVAEVEKAVSKLTPEVASKKKEQKPSKKQGNTESIISDNTTAAVVALTSALLDNGLISNDQGTNIANILGIKIKCNVVYSQAELDDMFENW